MSQTLNTQAVTVVTHEGGLKLTAETRGHRIATDQPFALGGTDTAPMPLDLIGAALGTCVALAVVQFCKLREIATDGLTVTVDQRTAKRPYRVDRYGVSLTLPNAFPPEYWEAIGRVARTCAAYNTLTNPPEIQVDVLAGQ
jgi:putative redox protein